MTNETMHGEILDAEIVGAEASGSAEGAGELALIDVDQFKLPAPAVFEAKLKGAFALKYAEIDSKIDSRTIDLTTKKGRDQIASDAYAISRLKTKMVAAAKLLVADQKAIILAVDAESQAMQRELDDRRDRARAPLNEWEETTKKIEAAAKAERAFMLAIRVQEFRGVLVADMTAAQLSELLEVRKAMSFDSSSFGDACDELAELNGATVLWLSDAVAAAEKAEADARELEELRKMRAEKIAAELAAQEAAAAEAAAEAAAAEIRAAQDLKAADAVQGLEAFAGAWADLRGPEPSEPSDSAAIFAAIERTQSFDYSPEVFGAHNLDKIERARLEAVAAVQALADQAAATEAEDAKRRAEAEAEAAAQAKADAEAEIKRQQEAFEAQRAAEAAERDKAAQRAALEAAEAQAAQVEAERARAADLDHRKRVNGAILRALIAEGLGQDQAKAAVIAMAQGKIPHVSIGY